MLQLYDSEAEVIATWEGQERNLDVYQAADGRIVIDADNNDYKVLWQELKCVVCGEQAEGEPDGEPMCYKHWEKK